MSCDNRAFQQRGGGEDEAQQKVPARQQTARGSWQRKTAVGTRIGQEAGRKKNTGATSSDTETEESAAGDRMVIVDTPRVITSGTLEAKWTKDVETFVLKGLFREVKVFFSQKELAYNSKVFQRIVLHFKKGLKDSSERYNLGDYEETRVRDWWKAQGAKRLYRKMQQRKSNAMGQYRDKLKGMGRVCFWSWGLLAKMLTSFFVLVILQNGLND